jgi:threonine aldolase
MVDRLAEDHANARALAEGIADVTPTAVSLDLVQTNMVMVDATAMNTDSRTIIKALKDEKILAGPNSPSVVRFVTHKDVDAHGVARAVDAFARVAKSLS